MIPSWLCYLGRVMKLLGALLEEVSAFLGQVLRVYRLAHFLFSVSASCVQMKCVLSASYVGMDVTSLLPD